MKSELVVCLVNQPKFQMQIKNKIVESSLLNAENMQNWHVRSVLLVKHFNQ